MAFANALQAKAFDTIWPVSSNTLRTLFPQLHSLLHSSLPYWPDNQLGAQCTRVYFVSVHALCSQATHSSLCSAIPDLEVKGQLKDECACISHLLEDLCVEKWDAPVDAQDCMAGLWQTELMASGT